MKFYSLLLSMLTLISMSPALTSATGDKSPAALVAFEREGDLLKFSVISTGCTSDDDFVLRTENVGGQTTSLTLFRLRDDLCKRMPRKMVITRTIADATSVTNELVLANPFIVLGKRK